jgi:NagD protein
MLRAARKELGLTTDQTIVIGDTMETDILGGVQLGFKTILVLSGGTRRRDLAHYTYRPDMIVESIADLNGLDLAAELWMEPGGELPTTSETDRQALSHAAS